MSDHQQFNADPDDSTAARRTRIRRLIIKGAFAAPVVASVAMGALTVEKAAAQTNTTFSKGSF